MRTLFKNIDWDVGEGNRIPTWERVQVAVLMDIRDELIRLNQAIYCPNFQNIPQRLKAIESNTKKRRKRKPK